MATNFYENVLPDDNTPADIPKILTDFAASTGQYVTVASRTEAEQRRTEKGTGLPLLVWRTDTKKLEAHPNTGASGETWVVISPPDQITSRDVWVKRKAPDGSVDDYPIHELFQEAFGVRNQVDYGTFEINLAGNIEPNKNPTFDTGNITLPRLYNKVPAVHINPYISPAGQVVQARAVVVTTSTFQVRTTRPAGYNPGAITFTYIAVGALGSAFNGGQ